MRYRLNGCLHVATVNDNVIDIYMQLNHVSMTKNELIRHIIEKELIHEPLRGEKEIDYAKRLANYSYFSNIGEWLEYWLHRRIEDKIGICRNCQLLNKEDDYCYEMQRQVNPNCKVCSECHIKREQTNL